MMKLTNSISDNSKAVGITDIYYYCSLLKLPHLR